MQRAWIFPLYCISDFENCMEKKMYDTYYMKDILLLFNLFNLFYNL